MIFRDGKRDDITFGDGQRVFTDPRGSAGYFAIEREAVRDSDGIALVCVRLYDKYGQIYAESDSHPVITDGEESDAAIFIRERELLDRLIGDVRADARTWATLFDMSAGQAAAFAASISCYDY